MKLTAILLGLIIGFFAALFFQLSKMHSVKAPLADDSETLEISESEKKQLSDAGIYYDENYPIHVKKQISPDVKNILVFGLDERSTDAPAKGSRSDSMIVLSLDRKNRVIKLTSLMRDLACDPNDNDGSGSKLNAAYAYGGIGLMVNTINENFDLDIQDFIRFDFWTAEDFIDAAGGVMVDVSEEELPHLLHNASEQARIKGKKSILPEKPGYQKLSGQAAIAWARIRAVGDDYGRTARQRTVIMSLLKSFSKMSLPGKAAFLASVCPHLTTSLSGADAMWTGIKNMPALSSMAEYRVPEDGMFTTDESNWNLIPDLSLQVPALHEFIYEYKPEKPSEENE